LLATAATGSYTLGIDVQQHWNWFLGISPSNSGASSASYAGTQKTVEATSSAAWTGEGWAPAQRSEKMRLYTVSEIARYDGSDSTKPILLAVKGRVYDVTKGKQHYQPGGSYHYLAAKDCTLGLCTSCNNADDAACKDKTVHTLLPSEHKSANEWINTYNKKYTLVGFLKGYYETFNWPEAAELKNKKKLEPIAPAVAE